MISREDLIAEARSWIGTPFHWGNPVKGVGCDCGTFPWAVGKGCGLIPADVELPRFTGNWWLHTMEERYKKEVARYARMLFEGTIYHSTEIAPGNLVLVRGLQSKVFNHSAIVTDWPVVIHCDKHAGGVVEVDVGGSMHFNGREALVFDPFEAAC